MVKKRWIGKVLALASMLLIGVFGSWSARASVAPSASSATLGPTVELWGETLLDETALATAIRSQALVALDAGEEYELEDLGPVGDAWHVVIYFDQSFTEGDLFRAAAASLGERARELTALGSVEVVLADPEVISVLPPTRDHEELADFLNWLNVRESADGAQRRLRRSFRRESDQLQAAAKDRNTTSLDRAQAVSAAIEGAAEEQRLIEEFLDPMLIWISENRRQGPQALILVSGGFDIDPQTFYSREVRARFPAAVFETNTPPGQVAAIDRAARAISAYGWQVFPFSPSSRGDSLPTPGGDNSPSSFPTGPAGGIVTGNESDRGFAAIDPRKLSKRKKEDKRSGKSAELVEDPSEPLQIFAKAGGGEVVTESRELSEVLQRLPLRRHFRYQRKTQSTVDQDPNLVEVSSARAGDLSSRKSKVAVRRWFSEVTPRAVSEARIRRILNDQLDEGDLLISAAARSERADRLQLQVQIQPQDQSRDLIDQIDTGSLRVTVAVVSDQEPSDVRHYGDPMDQGEGIFTLEAIGSSNEDRLVVVLVEDLSSGLWGAVFASELETAQTSATSALDDAYLLPGPKAIHLLAPRSAMVTGSTTFRTVLSEPGIAQVDFYLDGEKIAARFSAPYAATMDLGPLPRTRQVGAVALDASGKEIARDEILVNGGSGVFRVRIVQPSADQIDNQTLTGPLDVTASIEGPDHRAEIDRVEFYWKSELVATRYAAPFRQRIGIPEENPKGYVRVIAYLEDGNSAEDVVFLNNPGTSERLQIDLVELYVVVTDRKGRPVKNLKPDQFIIREEGEEQEIATFGDAGELPLTVGLAIDSSASMFVKLGEVRVAAGQFVRGLETRRDRAFLVGFGDEPELYRTTTSNLPEILHALDRLAPDGQTSLWKAVVYSLVQLQGVPGKKALIVYTDGADEDPEFSYRTCLRFARQVGVPIYFILTNNEIVRTDGKGLNIRGFLGRLRGLTEDVGGRVFLSRLGEDLEAVYREIDEELRSQYVLGFYTESQAGLQWKSLEVDASGSGLRARTIAGFYR